jgi:hypothetical protein
MASDETIQALCQIIALQKAKSCQALRRFLDRRPDSARTQNLRFA